MTLFRTSMLQQLQGCAMVVMHRHLKMLVMAPMSCPLHVMSRTRSMATNAVSRCSKGRRIYFSYGMKVIDGVRECRGRGGGAKAGFSCSGVYDGHTALFVHFEVENIPIALMHLRLTA